MALQRRLHYSWRLQTRSELIFFFSRRFGSFEEFKKRNVDASGNLTPHKKLLCGLGIYVIYIKAHLRSPSPHTIQGPGPCPPLHSPLPPDMFKLVKIEPSDLCLIDRRWYLRGDLRRDSYGNSKGQVHRRPGEGETSLQGLLPRSEDHRARTG